MFTRSVAFVGLLSLSALATAQMIETPRIESVVSSDKQPHETDPATIWYDDFNHGEKTYTESSRGIDTQESFGVPATAAGSATGSMLCLYEQAQQGQGNRKVFFGDSPTGKVVRKGEKFTTVYWRIYVKHQPGWTGGGPAKMSRATAMVSGNWNQAMIAHVWSSGEALTLDPASGIKGNQVVTTRYNDFANLRWLGNKPTSRFLIHSSAEAGWWVCVESMAQLNTPGKKDGVNRLWIDGRPEAERVNLDWRGSWDGKGINAVFLEAYWNQGSPVTQKRWYDNFVISTQPIGPVTTPRNPVLIRSVGSAASAKPRDGESPSLRGDAGPWEVELATDPDGQSVVWKNKPQPAGQLRVKVDATTGQFVGALSGKTELAGEATYYGRIRQQGAGGAWSAWSAWHQGFVTEK